MSSRLNLGKQLKSYLDQIDDFNLDDVHYDTAILKKKKGEKKPKKIDKPKVKEERDDLERNLKNEINIDETTIEFLTKDLHPGRFFSRRQTTKYTDLTVVAMLIKYQYLKTYKCCKCRITDKHNRKPITLLVNHINGHKEDFSIKNLELICPNCYFQTYGVNLLEKKIEKEIYTCKYCNYPLNATQRMNKNLLLDKDRCVCFVCAKKINENNTYNTLDDYDKEFKKLKKNSYKNQEEVNRLINTFRVDDYNGEFDSDQDETVVDCKFNVKSESVKKAKLEDKDLNINLELDLLMSINDIEMTDDDSESGED